MCHHLSGTVGDTEGQGGGVTHSGVKGVDWSSSVMSLLLQTLPVGSLVFSVLATDKDTGPAGVVQYFIKEVSVGPTTPHDH